MADQLLLGYTVLDESYQNGKFMQVLGDNPGTSGNIAQIHSPAATGVAIESSEGDPVIFSYAYNGKLRVLLGKITTDAGTVPSIKCLYSLLESPNGSVGSWKVLSTNVKLTYNGVSVATNPHGIAHIGEFLYIVDYDTRKVYLLGTNDLNGKSGSCPVTLFDVGAAAGLSGDAKGQAVIALSNGTDNYLYVLYLVADDSATTHENGILVRLTAAGSSLSYANEDQAAVGKNPQEIIPVTNSAGVVSLLIPAIGGTQGANTNAGLSNIISVPAFDSFVPSTLITGDTGSYDIRVIGASAKADDDALVYILTANFTVDWTGVNWKLYKTTVSQILGASNLSLSAAVANGTLSVVDTGLTQFSDYSGVYFLDLLYENAAVANGKERLWFFRGSPLLVTVADAYGSPTKTGNAYNFYTVGSGADQLGGKNVNSADLFAETIRQAAAGASLKRGVKAAKVPKVTARGVSVEAEEEEK